MNYKETSSTYETLKKIRNDWGNVNPVTKVIPNKKKNPKIKHKSNLAILLAPFSDNKFERCSRKRKAFTDTVFDISYITEVRKCLVVYKYNKCRRLYTYLRYIIKL